MSDLQKQVDALAPWYHDITLPGGIQTGGWKGIAHVWENIRKCREPIVANYAGAAVLDLGSWDGGWAFEAEAMGAKTVVAYELGIVGRLEHFLLCRAALNSRVIPMYGMDAERVDEMTSQFVKEYGQFDIVQHLGLLYHLKNPMRSLEAARRVIKTGGYLLIETAGIRGEGAGMLSNDGSKIYEDQFTYWAPTTDCLLYMLGQSGFRLKPDTLSVRDETIPRIALIAEAI